MYVLIIVRTTPPSRAQIVRDGPRHWRILRCLKAPVTFRPIKRLIIRQAFRTGILIHASLKSLSKSNQVNTKRDIRGYRTKMQTDISTFPRPSYFCRASCDPNLNYTLDLQYRLYCWLVTFREYVYTEDSLLSANIDGAKREMRRRTSPWNYLASVRARDHTKMRR